MSSSTFSPFTPSSLVKVPGSSARQAGSENWKLKRVSGFVMFGWIFGHGLKNTFLEWYIWRWDSNQSSYETWYNEGEKVRFLNPPTSKAFQFSQLVNEGGFVLAQWQICQLLRTGLNLRRMKKVCSVSGFCANIYFIISYHINKHNMYVYIRACTYTHYI